MLSSAMNSSVYNTSFVKNMYNVINSNFLDKENKNIINDFTIFDKFAIAVSLKDKISDETSITFDEKNNIVKKLSLKPIIEKFKTFNTPKSEFLEVDNENFKIKLEISVPTILEELEYEEQINKKEKKVDDIKNTDDIQKIISVFLSNIFIW